MALRLLKVLVPSEGEDRVFSILEEYTDAPRWWHREEDASTEIQVLLQAEGAEPLLDELERALEGMEGFRIILLPVQATVPRIAEPEPDPKEPEHRPAVGKREENRTSQRISREELYTTVSESVGTTRFYLVLTGLSSIVACASLLMEDTAVIIGAMVIAPLLGPNMAISFATTVGDVEMGRTAFRTSAAGAAVAFGVAVLLGLALTVDPSGAEIASRTTVGFGHMALALAAGAAAVLSLTRGVAAGLVGVMVAVALLPPLAAAGLLIGDGRWELGIGALLLTVANLACINLAGIGTFLAQGVRPLSWWEGERAKRATFFAVAVWALVVIALLVIIWVELQAG